MAVCFSFVQSSSPTVGRESWLMVLQVSGSQYFRRVTEKCVGSSSIYPIYQRNVWAGWELTICLCKWLHSTGSCSQASRQTSGCCLPQGNPGARQIFFLLFVSHKIFLNKSCIACNEKLFLFVVFFCQRNIFRPMVKKHVLSRPFWKPKAPRICMPGQCTYTSI